jgi:hypothetical protein
MAESEYLNNINKSISFIESIDINKSWAYEQIVEGFLRIKKLPIILFKYPKGNFLFRSRLNDGSSIFYSKSEISAPHERFVSNYSRANKPRQVLFYCSEDRPTSYFEQIEHLAENASFGDEIQITIGRWLLNEDLQLGLVFNPLAPRTNKYSKHHGEAFDSIIDSMPETQRKGTIKFFEFIGKEYSKQSSGNASAYKITCAYSNIVFGYEQCDGIIYPSVPGGGEGFNVVLKKEVSKNNILHLEDARIDKFVTRVQKNGKHNFVNTESTQASEIKYDSIEWNNPWE